MSHPPLTVFTPPPAPATTPASWRPLPNHRPGPALELRTRRWRVVVALEHYGWWSWSLQLDVGLVCGPHGICRRMNGDVVSEPAWQLVDTGHALQIEQAKVEGRQAAADLRNDMGGIQ